MNKDILIQIYYETIDICKNIPILYSKSSAHFIKDFNKQYHIGNLLVNISVVNQDIIQTILQLDIDVKPLVLNLASFKNVGGGVANGCMAQEEEISRKTSFMMHDHTGLYKMKHDQINFTPDVIVIRDANYNLLIDHERRLVDIISVAALKDPKLDQNNNFYKNQRILTKEKIETIFKFAIDNKYNTIILGALGCGAYHNPSHEIINIFNECIIKYGKNFKNIIFSVLSKTDKNFNQFNKFITRNF